jgi:hypothetical protein
MKRATLVLVALALLLGGVRQAKAGFVAGLQAYYAFDGNGLDSSGNGRDLTLVGNPGFAPGMFGQALDLHGDGSQYAIRPVVDSAFQFGFSDFTIQVWVNFNVSPALREQTLIEMFEGESGPGWTLTAPNYADGFQFFANPAGILQANNTATTGVWEQVVVERGRHGFELFVDDRLVAGGASSSAIPSSSNPLLIGRRDAADGRDFSVNGRIDDVAIWNRALTDDEIATLWNGGAGTPVLETPEPASLTLSLIGMTAVAGCGWLRRRRERGT